METARLVLDYVKALVWPTVTVAGLLLFRQQLRDLSNRVSRATFMGVEIETAVREAQTAIEDAVSANTEEPVVEPSDPVADWLEPNLPRSDVPYLDEVFENINKVERLVRRFAYEVDDTLVGRTTMNAAHSLATRGLIQRSYLTSLTELLHVRDNVGVSLNPGEAGRLSGSALQLLLVLQLALHAYRHPRTRVVGDA